MCLVRVSPRGGEGHEAVPVLIGQQIVRAILATAVHLVEMDPEFAADPGSPEGVVWGDRLTIQGSERDRDVFELVDDARGPVIRRLLPAHLDIELAIVPVPDLDLR